jgi:hypothetical protein
MIILLLTYGSLHICRLIRFYSYAVISSLNIRNTSTGKNRPVSEMSFLCIVFTVHLMTMSLHQRIQRQMIRRLMDKELKRMCKQLMRVAKKSAIYQTTRCSIPEGKSSVTVRTSDRNTCSFVYLNRITNQRKGVEPRNIISNMQFA